MSNFFLQEKDRIIAIDENARAGFSSGMHNAAPLNAQRTLIDSATCANYAIDGIEGVPAVGSESVNV